MLPVAAPYCSGVSNGRDEDLIDKFRHGGLAARIWSLTQQPLQHKTRLSCEHLRHVHPMPTRCHACFRRPYGRHRPACGWLLLLAVSSGRLWLLWWETDY
jgi:hypothetical protein